MCWLSAGWGGGMRTLWIVGAQVLWMVEGSRRLFLAQGGGEHVETPIHRFRRSIAPSARASTEGSGQRWNGDAQTTNGEGAAAWDRGRVLLAGGVAAGGSSAMAANRSPWACLLSL